MKPITTGTEDFREFIEGNYYYIDKSDFIETVFQDKVSLFTRPRRFGKTLNMSMLYYFLSNREAESSGIFQGLRITRNPRFAALQNRYPVIFLTLKDMKQPDFIRQTEYFASIIAREIRRSPELFDSPRLLESEKELLRQYDRRTASVNDLEDALLNLSVWLEKHYGKKVILLIDEYDVPLHTAYLNGYYQEMSNFLSSLFSSALKTNASLERGVLTGCLRISRESIFTGLNNFSVCSILSRDSSSRQFGFTPDEVSELLRCYHLEEYAGLMAAWYDGYLFGEQEMKTAFEELIRGNAVSRKIEEELTYREAEHPEHIYSYMLFTGYLKVKEAAYDESGEPLPDTYRLVIPNYEVRTIFENQFRKYFQSYVRDKKGLFLDALRDGNVNRANALLNDILFHSVSFYDDYEAFYHGFLTGLFSDLQAESNRESGDGRFDIAVLSDNPFGTNVLIECKKSKSRRDLKTDSQKAAEQILDKKYVEGLRERGYEKIRSYGIAFFEKSCYITEGGRNDAFPTPSP